MTREHDLKWILKAKYNVSSETELSPRDARHFYNDRMSYDHGEPAEYIMGWTEFMDCKIYLDLVPAEEGAIDKRGRLPLIPRTETEFWTEKAITEIQKTFYSNGRLTTDNNQRPQILDLCAGSGCIGIAVAKAVPEALVDFIEIDPAHLPTIEKNLRENLPDISSRSDLELSKQYRVFASDLFSQLGAKGFKTPTLHEVQGVGSETKETYQVYDDEASGTHNAEIHQRGRFKYDYILSNPPYIDPALDRTQDSVKGFEPHQALYGGKNGLEVITQIITSAPQHLQRGGQLWIEHEPEQSADIRALGSELGFLTTTHNDQYQIERYSVMVLQ